MFKIDSEKQYIEQQLPNRLTKRYIKGRTLGKGGFAQCYEFVSQQTGKHYAAKVIAKESLAKGKAKEKLQSQILIHKGLRHRHIVKFQHFFQDHDFVYILLQLCSHNTLNQLLKRRKVLTEPQVKYYIYQLLQAVSYTHKHQIIHRDLKLGNLFLDQQLQIKVGDFGLATTLTHPHERRKTVCGTPNYIAPQILESRKGHSYEVDSWSIGVIVYALLFGRPPFQTNEVKLTYQKIKKCQFQFPKSKVSEQAKTFIRRMLVLNPAQRATIDELITDQYLNCSVPVSLPLSSLACPPTLALLQYMPQQAQTSGRRDHTNNSNKEHSIQGVNSRRTSKQSIKESLRNKYSTERPQCPNKPNKEDRSHGSVSRATSSALLTKKKLVCWLREDREREMVEHFEEQPKFGMFYALSNQNIGMLFNDMTALTTDSNMERFKYFGRDKQHPEQFLRGQQKEHLKKKVKILNHFGKLHIEKYQSTTSISSKSNLPNTHLLSYHTHNHYSLFILSNNTQQAIFKDGMSLIIDKENVLVSKNGKKHQFKISSVEGENIQVRQRYHHVQALVRRLQKTKTVVIEDRKEREKEKENGSLGRSVSQAKLVRKVQNKSLLQKRVNSTASLQNTLKRPLGQHFWNKDIPHGHSHKSKAGHN